MSVEYEEHQHQRIMRQLKYMQEMEAKLAKCHAALLIISEWKLPYSLFEVENGSNRTRDYFKKIAKEALT